MASHSKNVQQALDIYTHQKGSSNLEYMSCALGVIEDHSGLTADDKEALKVSTILWLAEYNPQSQFPENYIDITFGKKVGDALKTMAAPNITEEKSQAHAHACAIVMALSCANMEGTLKKLSDPSTRAEGLKETGGAEGFAAYDLGIIEERLALGGYRATPTLLKYEMSLLQKISDDLKGITPAQQKPGMNASM